MVRVLVAAIVAMLASIVVGPTFIEYQRRREMGQHIREEGPQGHVVKQGTPTMGGLLILFCAMFPFLALSHYTVAALTELGPGTHMLTNAGHMYPPGRDRPGEPADEKAARFGPRFAARRPSSTASRSAGTGSSGNAASVSSKICRSSSRWSGCVKT